MVRGAPRPARPTRSASRCASPGHANTKAFDLVPLRIFGLGQTLVSAPFCAAYLVTLVTGGSEDVTEICFEEPVDQTFRTPLGDL